MTFSAEFKENLLWQTARFMVDSKPGEIMIMPAGILVKKMDGRFALSRTGLNFSTLFAPTSDKIVHIVEGWAKEIVS
jgi:hypothetical protein